MKCIRKPPYAGTRLAVGLAAGMLASIVGSAPPWTGTAFAQSPSYLSPSDLEAQNDAVLDLRARGKLSDAYQLAQELLEKVEGQFGRDHELTLRSLNNIALLQMDLGIFKESEINYLRLLTTARTLFDETHPAIHFTLNNIATLYLQTGRYAEAEEYFGEALEIRRRLYGPQHPETLTTESNLVYVYLNTGRFSLAEEPLMRILEISRREFGENHPFTLRSLNNLASFYSIVGRTAEAEALYQDAAATVARIFEPTNPNALIVQDNLGKLYSETEQFEKAEPLLLDTLEKRRSTLGEMHPDTGAGHNNLGFLYSRSGRRDAAEQQFRQAYDIFAAKLGARHLNTLSAQNNRGVELVHLRRYAEAKTVLEEVLDIRSRTFGETHPDTLTSRNNLAFLHVSMGNPDLAEPLYRDVLAHRRDAIGIRHPETLQTLTDLSNVLVAAGRTTDAVGLLKEGLEQSALRAEIEADASVSRERRSAALTDDQTLSDLVFTVAAQTPSAMTAELAAFTVLNRKGRLGEKEAELLRFARTSAEPALKQSVNAYLQARHDLVISFRNARAAEGIADTFGIAVERVDELERVLYRAMPELRQSVKAATRLVEVADIQNAMPPRGTLVEFVIFRPAPQVGGEPSAGPHVGAVVLRRDKISSFKDLGPLAAIADNIREMSADLTSGTPSWSAALKLHAQLMEPLSGEIDDAAPLFISPAGILGRIPFDMLVGRNGARLVESDPMLRFVPTGRAFLNERTARQKGQLLALGGIDYERSSTETSDIEPEPAVTSTIIAAAVARGEAKDLAKRLGDGGGRFLPLNATLTEIETIERIWRGLGGGETVLKTGPNALEGILSDIKGGPRTLHLATHGFVTDLDSERSGYRESLGSGIALAGANRLLDDAAKAADLDGIVFGYEIEAMDLTDTELVVVSSCDSGSGVADENEGVYSLARAFRLAGAAMSLVTLRPVDDDLTAQFMEEFYSAWLSDGQGGPADALARVKRSWAASRDRRRSNPRSWAPFLLVENGF